MRQVLVIRCELLGLHLQLLFGVDGRGALVEVGIAERAILLPNRTVDFARIAIEVVFFGIPNEAEQTRERIFAVDRFAFEHAARDLE